MAEIMTAVAKFEAGMRFEGEASSGHRMLLDASAYGGGQNAGFHASSGRGVGAIRVLGLDVAEARGTE